MHDTQIKTYYDGSFYALFLDYLSETENSLSFPAFMKAKPFWVKSSHKVVSCICVHHRGMVLRAKALATVRAQLHKHHGEQQSKGCTHASSCTCKCRLCLAKTDCGDLGDFKDTVMCARVGNKRHYKVACVLGKCKECGWDRTMACCPIETDRQNSLVYPKMLETVEVDTPKGTKKMKAVVTKETHFHKLMSESKDEVRNLCEPNTDLV